MNPPSDSSGRVGDTTAPPEPGRPGGPSAAVLGAAARTLSPVGRISPSAYVWGVLAPVVLLAGVLTTWSPEPSVAPILTAPLYWIFLVGLAKRLQDVGLAGLPLSAPPVLGLWLGSEAGLTFPAWLDTYVYVALGVLSLFAAFTAGARGANRYGPAPTAASGAWRRRRGAAASAAPLPSSVGGDPRA